MKIYRTISQINNLEQKLVWLAMAAAIGLAATYVCLINSTIMNVVARKEAYEAISNINAELSVLESRYVAATNDVTLEKAHALGFGDAIDRTSFAYIGGKDVVTMR